MKGGRYRTMKVDDPEVKAALLAYRIPSAKWRDVNNQP